MNFELLMPHKDPKQNKAYRSTPAYRKKAAARTAAWRKAHPNGFKEWAAKNKDRRQKYGRVHRKKNATRIRRNKTAWNRANPDKVSASNKRTYHQHGGRARQLERHLKHNYGITEADYEKMLVEQSGVCAICHRTAVSTKSGRRLSVDHCHKSKKVRGLLCRKCNSILGYAGDDLTVLLAAVDYLRRHS